MFARNSHARRSHVFLGMTGLTLACLTPTAHADTPSYSVSGWQYEGAADGQVGNYTLGYNFTPTHDITVSALGEWVPLGLAIQSSETVGIFDSSGDLLFSSTYNQANATLTSNTLPSGSQFRYVDITSLFSAATRTLLANTSYTVAGTVGNNSYATTALDLTPSSDITITSDGLYNNGDTISGAGPTPPATDAGYNLYGLNFETGSTAPTATPEPGAWALLSGLTTCGVGFLRRRRRKA